ncbi:MAG: hypothetical protein ACHQ7M_19925, partial [Chloroflexota bacterium]
MRRILAWRWPALLPVFPVLLAACGGATSPTATAPAPPSTSAVSKPAESPATSELETVKVAIPAK